jgi:hypothetical protein
MCVCWRASVHVCVSVCVCVCVRLVVVVRGVCFCVGVGGCGLLVRYMGNGPSGVWVSGANNNAALVDFSATCYYTALNLKYAHPHPTPFPPQL